MRRFVPLVCKGWAELYRSQDASPLHETLLVDFYEEVKALRPATKKRDPPHPFVRASRVISWAERHASSVRKLCLAGAFDGALQSFSLEDLGTLVAIDGSFLTALRIGPDLYELCQEPFWESLRDSVAPHGRLCSFVVEGIASVVNESDVEPLGQLAGTLEELVLETPVGRPIDLLEGLWRFPEFFCTLTELRRLVLSGHQRMTAVPAAISSLKKLQDLELTCDLASLPKELGELTGLTKLNLAFNDELAIRIPADDALPTESGKLRSLRIVNLVGCAFETVPAFLGELQSLELLDLSSNDDLQIVVPLDFLVEGCPRLREVNLRKGRAPWSPWTPESRAHLEAFKPRLLAKNLNAKVKY